MLAELAHSVAAIGAAFLFGRDGLGLARQLFRKRHPLAFTVVVSAAPDFLTPVCPGEEDMFRIDRSFEPDARMTAVCSSNVVPIGENVSNAHPASVPLSLASDRAALHAEDSSAIRGPSSLERFTHDLSANRTHSCGAHQK